MTRSIAQYAQVVVDAPQLGLLDYQVPEDMLVAVGDRVLVNLVTRKVVGVVVGLAAASDIEKRRLKRVLQVLKDTRPLSAEWLALTRFAARYYQRGWGEAAVPALPAFFRRVPKSAHERMLEKARHAYDGQKPVEPSVKPLLNDEQRAAVEAVEASQGFAPFLLFGVTGSGKTEVYLRLIEDALARDPEAQVLLLVPEINLTPQLQNRVRARFPDELVVSMHSEYSEGERAAAWLAAHEGRARILVGTRLSIFASFQKLALILVDEEHDLSYKAGDGLRFSARDLAVWRASKNACPVVLGSATPSLESWLKAQNGGYRLLELKHRAAEHAQLPVIDLIDPKPRGSRGLVSEAAREAVEKTLGEGRQVLLFLNRRGYSPVLSCPSCGWVSACARCSAFMVYHKQERTLICHHCGLRRPVPEACPACGNVDILPKGIGTERLEEELQTLFPDKRVLRIDLDSAARKNEAAKAFEKVHKGEVDILVGTQMVAKGHDFQNVGLVVILNPDAQLLSPSVRAKEHLFSTLMQVAGRAGRAGRQGNVLIQTRFKEEPLFAALADQNYRRFAETVLKEREENWSVPFVFQAVLYADAPRLDLAVGFLRASADAAQRVLPEDGSVRVYDPVPMPLVRFMNRERAQLLFEADDRLALNRFLTAFLPHLGRSGDVLWTIEVDPSDV